MKLHLRKRWIKLRRSPVSRILFEDHQIVNLFLCFIGSYDIEKWFITPVVQSNFSISIITSTSSNMIPSVSYSSVYSSCQKSPICPDLGDKAFKKWLKIRADGMSEMSSIRMALLEMHSSPPRIGCAECEQYEPQTNVSHDCT